MQENKRFLAKIFNRNGTTLAVNIKHKDIRDFPSWTDRINGGMGECVIDYAVPFDDFGEGVTIEHQFILQVWVFDDENPNGRKMFGGAIQEYEPYIDGAKQGVLIKALGFASNLSFDAYMASSRTVYSVVHTTQDPQAIFKAIIDEHIAGVNNQLINYEAGSTEAVGANVSKTFTDIMWFDACDETRDLCGAGWWWHVDADGIASLLPKPATATHRFIIGKHISTGNFPKSVKPVKNKIRMTRNGGGVTEYADATSKAAYEQRLEMIGDTSLTDVGAANQEGNKKLGDLKDPKTRSTLTINTQYDLESIKVGQTCSILNSDNSISFFGDNIMIVGLSYDGDTVQLELEESASDLGLALDKFVNGQ